MTTPEIGLLHASLQQLLQTHDEPSELRAGEGHWMSKAWRDLAEMGIPWLGIDEDRGGSGGTATEAALAVRLLAAHGVTVPVGEMALLAGWALTRAHLDIAPDQPITTAVGPSAGGLSAVRDGDDILVTGEVHGVPWAADCELIVTAVSVGGEDHVLAVPVKAVRVEPGYDIAGERRDTVTIDGLPIPASAASAVPGVAALLAARAAAIRAVAIAGAAETVLALTAEHARMRRQFGKPIGQFQAVGHMVAELAGATAATQAAAVLAVTALETDDERLAAAAKVVASESAGRIVALAHQVHGAIGMTREHPLHLHTRHLLAWRDEYGNEDYWAAALGTATLAPPHAAWAAVMPL
ncbi:acyl-CoA dehydrogenase domain-containing protein [Mycolicibacterium rhodesiae JS60]|nr:acyl-CoA dehydrogenase domain-containing protein [Mycolicibacterium rhodesiae JS60]